MNDFDMSILKYEIKTIDDFGGLLSIQLHVGGENHTPDDFIKALKAIDQLCAIKIFPEQKA